MCSLNSINGYHFDAMMKWQTSLVIQVSDDVIVNKAVDVTCYCRPTCSGSNEVTWK